MNVLLVEDDPSVRAAIDRTLACRGMRVTACANRGEALARWRALQPDVVVLDLGLADAYGLDVLVRAREQGLRTPVMALSARGTVGDCIVGLNAGADDHLAKPFHAGELEARVRALARRSRAAASPHDAAVRLGRLRLDTKNGAFYDGDALLELTPREAALLRALASRPGCAIAKEKLFDAVFPGEMDVQYSAIEVVVHRLRKKLARTDAELATARGLGYLLKPGSS